MVKNCLMVKNRYFLGHFVKILITQLFWLFAILGTKFCCQLMNIFLTQFWTVRLLIHKPQTRHILVRKVSEGCI